MSKSKKVVHSIIQLKNEKYHTKQIENTCTTKKTFFKYGSNKSNK